MKKNKGAKVIESKNARAVAVLKSWFKASGISFRVCKTGGADLAVASLGGSEVLLQVSCADSPKPSDGVVVLEGATITGRKVREALAVYIAFIVGLGFEGIAPVSRGEIPEKKLTYEDDFEAVAWRHSELRRCPNPTAAQIKKYDVVLKKATWNFLRLNADVCGDNMLAFDDLFSYAQVWTVNYLGYYEIPEELCTADNNDRKLYAFIWQRYSELRSLLKKKGRSILVDRQLAEISRTGTVENVNVDSQKNLFVAVAIEDEEEAIDEAFVARKCQLDTKSPVARRNSATSLLEKSLNSLSHGEFVELLTNATENLRIDPEARREASRRLADHSATCSLCSGLKGLSDEDEDVSGVDTGCCEE
ncbi:MAG: hypothetical protein H0U23_00480 [Blastocatellia bacterium]|nr:hypothetical protein [Blastocatellia bacterium]